MFIGDHVFSRSGSYLGRIKATFVNNKGEQMFVVEGETVVIGTTLTITKIKRAEDYYRSIDAAIVTKLTQSGI